MTTQTSTKHVSIIIRALGIFCYVAIITHNLCDVTHRILKSHYEAQCGGYSRPPLNWQCLTLPIFGLAGSQAKRWSADSLDALLVQLRHVIHLIFA